MSTRELVPAAPLKAVIERDAQLELARSWHQPGTYQNGVTPLGERIGIHPRILTRVLGQQTVTLDVADHYCCAAGHLLAEVYPEAYDALPPAFTAYCRRCHQDVDMDILAESHERMHLRCRDCGRGRYLNRVSPNAGRRYQSLPASTADIVADYASGMSMSDVGKRHGMTKYGVGGRLRRAGYPIRPRGGARPTATLDEARRVRRELAAKRGETAARLRAEGVSPVKVAMLLGMSPSGERAAFYAWRDTHPEAAP